MLNYQHFKKWCFIALTCIAGITYASPGGNLRLKVVNLSTHALSVQASNPNNTTRPQPSWVITLQPSQSVTFSAIGMGDTHCNGWTRTCPDESFNVNYSTGSGSSSILIYNFRCTGCAPDSGGNWTMRVIDQTGVGNQNWFAMCGSAGWTQWPNGGRCDQNGGPSDFAYNFIISGHPFDAWAVAYYQPMNQ